MADFDFSALMSGMCTGGSNPIKNIFDIVPTYDNVQMDLRFKAQYFIEKWDLDDARQLFKQIDKMMTNNKNLTFLGSKNLKDLLAAQSQMELVRGVKVQAINNNNTEGGAS